MTVTKLMPGGDTVTRLVPGGDTVTRLQPGGDTVTRLQPGGDTVTRLSPSPKARGGASDAFQERVEGSTATDTALIAWWSPNGADAGNLATGDTVMRMMSTSEENPDIKARVKDAGDWKIVEDNIGSSTSLTSAVEANEQRRVESPYEDSFCGLDTTVSLGTKLDEILGGDDGVTHSGFVFFKPAANVYYQDILVFRGDDSSGQTSNYTSTFSIRFVGNSPWDSNKPVLSLGTNTTFNKRIVLQDTFESDKWWYIAWRMTSRSGTSSAFTIYAVKADGNDDWSDVVSGSHTFDVGFGTGLTFGHESSHSADDQDGWRWGPIGLFMGDIGVGDSDTTLKTIFEAVG